nr:hypothetical protein [Tanacetum cinerariifolium]
MKELSALIKDDLKRQLFGLPPRYRDSVRAITPGLPLFLYNYTTHQLQSYMVYLKAKRILMRSHSAMIGETEIKDDDAYKEELLDYEEGDEKAPYSAALSANGNSLEGDVILFYYLQFIHILDRAD